MPQGFGTNQMPQGFGTTQVPPDFITTQVPQGFSHASEGFGTCTQLPMTLPHLAQGFGKPNSLRASPHVVQGFPHMVQGFPHVVQGFGSAMSHLHEHAPAQAGTAAGPYKGRVVEGEPRPTVFLQDTQM